MTNTTPLDKYRNFELEEQLNFSWEEYNKLGIWESGKWAFKNTDANNYVLDTQKRQKLDIAFDEDLKAVQAEIKSQKQAQREVKLQEQLQEQHQLHCPKCGSTNLQSAGDNSKKFSGGKAVLGGATLGLLTGGIGIVAGAGAGFAGKKGRKNQFVCMNCGKTVEVRK